MDATPGPLDPPAAPLRLFGMPHPRGWPVLRGYWARVDAVTEQRQRTLLVGMLALPLGVVAVTGVLAGAVVTVGCLETCINPTGDPVLGGTLWMLGTLVGGAWCAAAAWGVGQARWSKRVFLLVQLVGLVLFLLSARGT